MKSMEWISNKLLWLGIVASLVSGAIVEIVYDIFR